MSFCSKCLGKYLAFDPQFWLHCHWFWIFSALPVTDITDHCIFELSVSWGALSGGQWSQSLSLPLFLSFTLHTALRKRDPALEACKEPPQPFSHCPLSLEKTAFSFSFLSLKMNSPINPSSTDHSEKERKRERRLELCVCEVFFRLLF